MRRCPRAGCGRSAPVFSRYKLGPPVLDYRTFKCEWTLLGRGREEYVVLDPVELSRMRLKIAAGMGLTVLFVMLAAVTGGMISDLAYSGTVLLTVCMTFWVVRWAKCSRLVRRLILCATFLLLMAQSLDITENIAALNELPLIGNGSVWNGRLSSIGVALGFVFAFTALTFALVETRLGRIAHERYGLLAENVSDVIFTADLNLACSYISPSITRLCGVTVEEALAQQPGEGMTRTSFARARELLERELDRIRQGLRDPEDATAIDLELIRKDGSRIWVETSVSFLLDETGQPSGILGVTRDITERKRAEDADRQLNERLTLAVRAGNFGVWDWDVSSSKLVWDERMYEIYGVEPEPCSGAFEDWRTLVQPEDLARAERELRDALKGRGELNVRFRVIRPTGEVRHVQSRAVVLRDEAGRPLRMIGMNTDITVQVEAEAERARLQEQLSQAQKLESIGRLAGGVAHDFNNMLTVILGYAEMVTTMRKLDTSLQEPMAEIQSAALRSADLTRQLLAFARQQTVAPRVIDLNESTSAMLKMLERLIGEGVKLTWRPGGALWSIKIDPSQVDQILANLCVNARDAIAGFGEISIQTRNVTLDAMGNTVDCDFMPGDYVRLAVSDNGCGMDHETLDHIFEPFFTTKKAGLGTGLGLSTVYGIVKQNGGFISVKSEPGQGTTVTIHLPRDIGETGVISTEVVGTIQIAPGHETILLVEDERAILALAQSMLQRLGYTVIAAATPGEAIRLAENNPEPFDLLLTDIVMPEMNGRDLVLLLTRRYPGLRYLYMSGYAADLISHDDLREGKNFIQKPFGMKELAAKVRLALDHAEEPQGTTAR
jgi:PAS domain S-box-containing protein